MNIEQMILKAIDNNEMIKFLRGEVILVGMFMILQNANILNWIIFVDALCLKKSKYFETEIPGIGTVYTVSKYGIYSKKVENSDVFKLANRQQVPLFVSEKFKKLIEEKQMTGIKLTEIDVDASES